MVEHPPEEIARRALPWYLLPKFMNVITSIPLKDVSPEKTYHIRNVELYVSQFSGIYIPGASTFLVVPSLKYDVEVDEKNKVINVTAMDGFVHGFMPDGTYAKFLAKTITESEGYPVLKYDGAFTDFSVSVILRNYLRLSTGKFFAYKVLNHMRKNYELFVVKLPGMKVDEVYLREGRVSTSIETIVSLYRIQYKNTSIVAPGVIPGILHLLDEINPVTGEAKDVLMNFLDAVASVGKRTSPLTGALLQRTSKTKFYYYIGEIDAPEHIVDELKNKYGDRVWLSGGPAYRGTRVNIYADLVNKKVYTTITMLPFNPPATLVLNYPPFNISPLAALMNERIRFLRYHLGKAEDRAKRLGLDIGFYDQDYEVLADAKITFDEVRQILKDGYPKLEHLHPLLEKAEKLGYIADLMSYAIGPVSKVDKLLVTTLKPVAEAKREEKTAEKEIKSVSEEEELAEIAL